MPPPSRRIRPSEDQPALPLDLGAPEPTPPRVPRTRSRAHGEAPAQLAFCLSEDEDPITTDADFPSTLLHPDDSSIDAAVIDPELIAPAGPTDPGAAAPSSRKAEPPPRVNEPAPSPIDVPRGSAAAEERPEVELETADFDPDPFTEIPGLARVISEAREFVLLPGSLRSRLDLREFTRFLASLPTVAKDWDGAPEIDDGGIRLRGLEVGAWIYPEANRVRLVTDGAISGPVGEDLVTLCRWLENRAGMHLYPAGETRGAGVDRSLDPWEVFGR